MTEEEYNFCLNYVLEFVSLLNYPVDNTYLESIEEDREIELLNAQNNKYVTNFHESIINSINNRYDNMIFNYIKEEVEDKNLTFFNERLNNMSKLLETFQDYAAKYKMILKCDEINDYYHNYIIAVNLILSDKRYLRGE